MDIRNSLDGLKSLLGVSQPAPAATPQPATGTGTSGASGASGALTSDSATVSSAGNEVALTASDPGVRMEKVTSIQSALALGTYNVPASAVASRMVDAMLGSKS